MTARLMLVLLLVGAALVIALGVMLAVGYVPPHAHGPQNERTFDLLGGVASGLLVAAALGQISGVRR